MWKEDQMLNETTPIEERHGAARDPSHPPPGATAFDMVYQPLNTPFLQAARAAGLRTVDGLTMLIGQARKAFRLFFGAEPPAEHDAELRHLLSEGTGKV